MTDILSDIQIYLPKYLSEETYQKLIESLRSFHSESSAEYYNSYGKEKNVIYQGDGLRSVPFLSFGSDKTTEVHALVFSNTCDIDISNRRSSPIRILLAPIISLSKMSESLLRSGKTDADIEGYFETIRKQEVTNIFYLPDDPALDGESFVWLDMIYNIPNHLVEREPEISNRSISLSQFGHYMLLMKLSIHFCRLQEGVDRH